MVRLFFLSSINYDIQSLSDTEAIFYIFHDQKKIENGLIFSNMKNLRRSATWGPSKAAPETLRTSWYRGVERPSIRAPPGHPFVEIPLKEFDQTGKLRSAVRLTRVSRHNGGPIEGAP